MQYVCANSLNHDHFGTAPKMASRLACKIGQHHGPWVDIRRKIQNKCTIGASRGIANPEINSGFGPGTFWRRDEIRKRKIAHLAQGSHQQGKCKSGNADCEDWSSSSRHALFLSRPRADWHYRYDINILTYGFVEGLGNSFQIGCIAQAS